MSTLAPVSQAVAATRYKFTECPARGGAQVLRIEGEDRNTVFGAATPTCLLGRYRDRREGWHIQSYGIFEHYPFAGDVASGLILGWEPPEGRRGWPGVRAWVWRQTGRTIGKRLHAFYKRCLCAADPTVLAFQRTVFAATFSTSDLIFREELYKGRLANDPAAFRAALKGWERAGDLPTPPKALATENEAQVKRFLTQGVSGDSRGCHAW